MTTPPDADEKMSCCHRFGETRSSPALDKSIVSNADRRTKNDQSWILEVLLSLWPPDRCRADGSKHHRIRAVDQTPQPCTPRGATAIFRFLLDYEWISWVSAEEGMSTAKAHLLGAW
jgi:hypothetical protein